MLQIIQSALAIIGQMDFLDDNEDGGHPEPDDKGDTDNA
jgi:hypothetical protein